MKTKFKTALFLLPLLTISCTWAPISTLGEKVRVLDASEVSSCSKKGKTTVSVKSDIIGIDRDEKTMSKELSRLARNSAPDLNGDTVVASSPIKNGTQTFSIYKCVDPKN